jgi:hypothetical protein
VISRRGFFGLVASVPVAPLAFVEKPLPPVRFVENFADWKPGPGPGDGIFFDNVFYRERWQISETQSYKDSAGNLARRKVTIFSLYPGRKA